MVTPWTASTIKDHLATSASALASPNTCEPPSIPGTRTPEPTYPTARPIGRTSATASRLLSQSLKWIDPLKEWIMCYHIKTTKLSILMKNRNHNQNSLLKVKAKIWTKFIHSARSTMPRTTTNYRTITHWIIGWLQITRLPRPRSTSVSRSRAITQEMAFYPHLFRAGQRWRAKMLKGRIHGFYCRIKYNNKSIWPTSWYKEAVIIHSSTIKRFSMIKIEQVWVNSRPNHPKTQSSTSAMRTPPKLQT